jgi:Rhodopirellula transposase DDE domain
MQRPGASEKRGGTPAASRGAATPGSKPPATVAGVHRRRSDARRRAVDEPVVARVVATTGGARHARQSSHDPTAPEKTQTGPTHGRKKKTMGHHPDRHAQCDNIARLRRAYEAAGDAVISIDTKKKE